MGGGVGLSTHAAHRIVTERSAIAMPEVGIGFFPDVGISFPLARTPGYVGTHLALTGDRMDAADAIYCGLADIHVPSRKSCRACRGARRLPHRPPMCRPGSRKCPPARRPAGWLRPDHGSTPATAPTTSRRSSPDCAPRRRWRPSGARQPAEDVADLAQGALRNVARRRHSRRSRRASSRIIASRSRASPGMISSRASARRSSTRTAIRRWRPDTLADVTPEIVDRHFRLRRRAGTGLSPIRKEANAHGDHRIDRSWQHGRADGGQPRRRPASGSWGSTSCRRRAKRRPATACRLSPPPGRPREDADIVITMLPAGEHVRRYGPMCCRRRTRARFSSIARRSTWRARARRTRWPPSGASPRSMPRSPAASAAPRRRR